MATKAYLEAHDRITMDVPLGKRAVYKEAAERFKMPLTVLFQRAVEEYINNHGGNVEPHEKLTPRDKLLLKKLKQLPSDTQRLVAKFVENMASVVASKGVDLNDTEEP